MEQNQGEQRWRRVRGPREERGRDAGIGYRRGDGRGMAYQAGQKDSEHARNVRRRLVSQ